MVLLAPLQTPEGQGLGTMLVLAESGHATVVEVVQRVLSRYPWQVVVVVGQDHDEALSQVLKAGAHECITLGSATLQLWARLRARLRDAQSRALGLPDLVVDPVGFRVLVGGHAVNMGALEFRFLSLLASEPGKVFTFDEVESFVYHTRKSASRESIEQLASRVRCKLGSAGDRIEAVRGVGFRLA